MAGFKLESFRGKRPKVSPRLLDQREGTAAKDWRLGSGELRPLRASVQEAILGAHQTAFLIRDGVTTTWRTWATDVDVVRGPVLGDTRNRHYFTGDGVPKMFFAPDVAFPDSGYGSTNWRKLGVPAPAAAVTYTDAPLISVTGVITNVAAAAIILPSDASFRKLWAKDPQPRFYTRDQGGSGSPFPAGSLQAFEIGFSVGDEFTVTVDSPTAIRITAPAANFLAAGEALNAAYRWGCEFPTESTNSKEETGGLVRPGNEGTITFAAPHGLRTGDTIQISAITTQPVSAARNEFLGLDGYEAALDTDVILDYVGSVEYEVFRDPNVTNIVDRAYVYTYVSDLGEEGPPSPPAAVVSVVDTDALTLTGFSAPPVDRVSIDRIRVYRAAVGSTGTAEYQFLVELPVGTATYNDVTTDFGLGEVIQSVTWDPPDENMIGLVSLPNGVMAGFFGRTLAMSEPGFPHAWPPEYRLTTDYDIVGLGVFGNSILVCTEGTPYVASGAQPRSVSLRRIEVEQACVSKQSIVNIGDVVLYASPDGLAAAGHNGFKLVSREYFDRDSWQALNPSTMYAMAHDEKYLAVSSVSAFIFDPTNPEVGLSDMSMVAGFVSGHVDLLNDTVYTSDGNAVYRWDNGAARVGNWRSKLLPAPHPMNPGGARVLATGYPLTFKLYADGVLVHTKSVADAEAFRLPGGYLASWFEVELDSQHNVRMVQVAETLGELMES